MEGLVSEYSAGGVTRERCGAILPGIAPSNVYPCLDGEYMIGANNDSIFRRLCEAMGEPALAQDPRYCDHLARGRHQRELDDHIGRWTATLTVDQLEAKMLAASIPAGRLYGAADMLADPHFAAREAIVAVDHPRWPGLKMQGVFPKLSATPGAIRSRAPDTPGQHNPMILGERLGLSDADLDALARQGVV
jgi:formyl-CoA transferase